MRISIITMVLTLCCAYGYCQEPSSKEKKANQAFEYFDYLKAIHRYERLETLTSQGTRNLATSYRKTHQMEKAEQVYAQLVTRTEAIPDDLYYYSYTLKENKKYLESDTWMDKYKVLASDEVRVDHYENSKIEVADLLKDNGQFAVENLNLNSAQQDFGPAFYKGQVVFASTRVKKSIIRREWAGNHMAFLDLYIAEDAINQLKNPKPFQTGFNKKFHEGPVSFAQDGRLMAFTTNNYQDLSSDGTSKLKLFFSESLQDDWSEPTPFYLNNKEYSTGHACLSEDGRSMYFVSDRPGGFGGADIYQVTQTDTGWSAPQNLGPQINTEGNEMFPFFDQQNQLLFFSSDGHVGLGGLDVYVSQHTNTNYSKVKNLGVPINSNKDDFSFTINTATSSLGYFSSNRDGGRGQDDIYSFQMKKPFVFGKRIEGIAKDQQGNALENTLVTLLEDGVVVDSIRTGADGGFVFAVESDKDFVLSGTKNKYFQGENRVSSALKQDVIQTSLELEKDPGVAIYLLVLDAKTNAPIDQVNLRILDNFSGKDYLKTLTDQTGSVKKGLAGKKIGDRVSFNITLSKEGFFPKTLTFNHQITKPGVIPIHELVSGGLVLDQEVSDLSELVEINPINFDVNQYNIRPDAAIELDKIVDVMNKYPGMVVELGSHTDCRGSMAYNEKLSDKRAKSSAQYIKTKITSPDHISGKGYGESKILNGCTCEGAIKSVCTTAQHADNRRTEFKVLSTGDDQLEVKNNSTDSFEHR